MCSELLEKVVARIIIGDVLEWAGARKKGGVQGYASCPSHGCRASMARGEKKIVLYNGDGVEGIWCRRYIGTMKRIWAVFWSALNVAAEVWDVRLRV